jgi:hypothetical protein
VINVDDSPVSEKSFLASWWSTDSRNLEDLMFPEDWSVHKRAQGTRKEKMWLPSS